MFRKSSFSRWLNIFLWSSLGFLSWTINAQGYLPVSYYKGETIYVWAENGLFLRAEPSLKGEVVTKMPLGAKLEVVSSGHGDEHSMSIIPEQDMQVFDWEGGMYKQRKDLALEGRWVKIVHGDEMLYVSSLYVSRYPPIDDLERFFIKNGGFEVISKIVLNDGDYEETISRGKGGVIFYETKAMGRYTAQLCLPLGEWVMGVHWIATGLPIPTRRDESCPEITIYENENRIILQYLCGGTGAFLKAEQIGGVLLLYYETSC